MKLTFETKQGVFVVEVIETEKAMMLTDPQGRSMMLRDERGALVARKVLELVTLCAVATEELYVKKTGT